MARTLCTPHQSLAITYAVLLYFPVRTLYGLVYWTLRSYSNKKRRCRFLTPYLSQPHYSVYSIRGTPKTNNDVASTSHLTQLVPKTARETLFPAHLNKVQTSPLSCMMTNESFRRLSKKCFSFSRRMTNGSLPKLQRQLTSFRHRMFLNFNIYNKNKSLNMDKPTYTFNTGSCHYFVPG